MYQPLICAAVLGNQPRGLGPAFDAKRMQRLANPLVHGVRRDFEQARNFLRGEVLVDEAQAVELTGVSRATRAVISSSAGPSGPSAASATPWLSFETIPTPTRKNASLACAASLWAVLHPRRFDQFSGGFQRNKPCGSLT
jgi:hypothetical protein